MVTKSVEKIFSYELWTDQHMVDNGIVTQNTSVASRGYRSYTSTRSGVNNPKWRATIKSGGDATSPMTGTDNKIARMEPFQYSGGFHAIPSDNREYSERVRGTSIENVTLPGTLPGTSLVSADNQALSRAYAQLNAVQSQFQGVVFLGELKETLHLLKHPFKGVDDAVTSYLKDLRSSNSFARFKEKRSRGNRNSFLTTAANAWLETAFGIRPLISDTKSLVEAVLKQKYGVKSSTISGSGFSVASRDSESFLSLGNTGAAKFSYIDRTTQSVRYKGRVDGTATAGYGSAQGVINALGFNPESFIPSVYELIPYSFLADYFTNLGDLINAGCSQAGLKFVVRTERFENSRAGVIAPYPLNTSSRYWIGDLAPGGVFISHSTVARSSSAKLGMPVLEFSFPGADMHAANILALLKSNERRILKTF